MKEYKNHKVYNISYHIVWIPKYRKKILKDHIRSAAHSGRTFGRYCAPKRERLIEILKECENKIDIKIEVYEIMIDHIHLFIKGNLKTSVSEIVKILKGYSSYVLRKEFMCLKKYKSLWTHSYYCETIGHISENTVKRYIETQMDH